MKSRYLAIAFLICALSCSASKKPSEPINGRYKEEADFILNTIRYYSIDTLRGLSEEQWTDGVNELYDKISKCTNDTSYYFALTYFGILLKDGHFSFPNIGVLNRMGVYKKSDIVFPIWVKSWTDGRLFVVKDYKNTVPVNSEILSVNGRCAAELVLAHRHLSYGEQPYMQTWINEREEGDPEASETFNNFLFMEHIDAPYKIAYKEHGRDEIKTIILDGITRGERFMKYDSDGDFDKFVMRKGLTPIEYTKLNDQTGKLTINRFWGGGIMQMLLFSSDAKFSKLLKQSISELNAHSPKNVIIDIRGCQGGYGYNIYETIAYFTDKPMNTATRYYVNKYNRSNVRDLLVNSYKATGISSANIKEALKVFDNLPEQAVFNSDTLFANYYKRDKIKVEVKDKNIYLLTSTNVFSAAIEFGNYFVDLGIGKTAGESPGAFRQVTSGNLTHIPLPYTDFMHLDIPYNHSNTPEWNGSYDRLKIDIPIDRVFEEWVVGKDSTLNRLVSIINSTQN